jgi:dTDP-4-dehydrorhamnose reductase
VVVTGSGGQLGRELVHTAPAGVELHALRHADLDITRRDRVREVLHALRPAVMLNAAAYTAVDRAESEPERARSVNAAGPAHLAEAAAGLGARLIHVSTDFVFDGGRCRPYAPEDEPRPLGVYGRTKLEGERRVLAAGGDAVVVRASWIYARNGRNFVNTMLRLMRERDEVGVVADQFGAPTWARGLARALWSLALEHQDVQGLLHYSDAGAASWYDLAVAVAE